MKPPCAIKRMISELHDAGWTKLNANVWESPGGEHFRGPYRAWAVMKRAALQSPAQPGAKPDKGTQD